MLIEIANGFLVAITESVDDVQYGVRRIRKQIDI